MHKQENLKILFGDDISDIKRLKYFTSKHSNIIYCIEFNLQMQSSIKVIMLQNIFCGYYK